MVECGQPDKTFTLPALPIPSGHVLCGLFHTHTSLRYCPTKFRKTGLSGGDSAAAVMVFISGCRTGMVCMAVIILLMFYREARRWVKPSVVRIWCGIIGGGLLLAVVLYERKAEKNDI